MRWQQRNPLSMTAVPLFMGLAVMAASASVAQTQTPVATPTPVVRSEPASKEELAGISARGKLLFEYDQAAWQGTDAAGSALRILPSNAFYVADKIRGNWVVSFGHLTEARDKFLVLVETIQRGKNDFRVTKLDAPKIETGRWLNLARAVSVCRAEFKGENRPYNIAILPGPKDGWLVYVMPAQTDARVFPAGGDVRYTVSPDGTSILETRRMHLSVQEFQVPAGQGIPAAMVRTAVLDDAPEDTDVFFAMTFKPATAHYIVSRNYVYLVTPQGFVSFLKKNGGK